ncbi:MAG: PilZ domain-containing protein [Polyangiales bacterium]
MSGRRVHERYDCHLPIVFFVGEEEVSAVVSNISLGGMFVVTDRSVEYGTPVKVRFRLPALKEEATVDTTVRWRKPDGVGLQFGSLRAIEVWALNQFFKGLTVTPEH